MLMRLNPASRHAAAFSGVMVSGSASSVTSSNWDGNEARIASMICARLAGSRRLGVPPPK